MGGAHALQQESRYRQGLLNAIEDSAEEKIFEKLSQIHRVRQAGRPRSDSSYYTHCSGRSLHIHFTTRGCGYARCFACDYGTGRGGPTRKAIETAFEDVVLPCGDAIEVLLVGSLGSVLDEGELPDELLDVLIQQLARTNVGTVIFETSCDSVITNKVERIKGALGDKDVLFELGLESFDDDVRRICFGKSAPLERYSKACDVIHACGAKTVANVLLGAPFLSVAERIGDARRSIMRAFEFGFDEVVLFPVNVKPYTLVRALYERNIYDPVSLSELFAVLAGLSDESLALISLAWWGNRSSSYSFPTVAPKDESGALTDLCEEFMSTRDATARFATVRAALESHPDIEELQLSEVPDASSMVERAKRAVAILESPFGEGELAWVGPRESDMDGASGLYRASSTVYGSGAGGNDSYCLHAGGRVNHNRVTAEQIGCMAEAQRRFVGKMPELRFMFYNPYWAYGGNDEVLSRATCMNSFELLEVFCNKLSFREFARRYVRIPECASVPARECTESELSDRYPEWGSFVIQRGISSGGLESYVWFQGDALDRSGFANLDEDMLVSRYYAQNVPVNVHAVVYETAIVILPGSVQIIDSSTGLLLYAGCDYVSFNDLSDRARNRVAEDARRLCEGVRAAGYRGILGLDAMVVDGEVIFLEMNARFQASSHALSRALVAAGFPSLHQMHAEAFFRDSPSFNQRDAERLIVPFSSIAYSSTGDVFADAWAEHVLEVAREHPEVEVFEDGLDLEAPRESDAYLFSLVFDSRVSSVVADKFVNVAQNVFQPKGYRFPESFESEADRLSLKIALLNQGAAVTEKAREAIVERGTLRPGVNSAIDLRLLSFAVNVPMDAPFREFSPFAIDVISGDGRFGVYYLGGLIGEAELFMEDPLESGLSSRGIPMRSMCLLALDRLRVQHHDGCDYACAGARCAFCDFPTVRSGFDSEDILEVVDRYIDSDLEFRHFLIGGGTSSSEGAAAEIARIAGHIRDRSSKPVYVMTIPIPDVDKLVALKDAGVTEVAFNIEVLDEATALALMPAKGAIPRGDYLDALEKAVGVWGRGGAVRSAIVVGLEPMDVTLECVKELCERGVSPILSVFRPMRGTPMENVLPPGNDWLAELHLRASRICDEHGVKLGPSCRDCKNNVLAL